MAELRTLGLGKTLEAAIRGIEIKQLDDACKAELKTYFKQMNG